MSVRGTNDSRRNEWPTSGTVISADSPKCFINQYADNTIHLDI